MLNFKHQDFETRDNGASWVFNLILLQRYRFKSRNRSPKIRIKRETSRRPRLPAATPIFKF